MPLKLQIVGGKMDKKVIIKALSELRKQKKRNFSQSVDLIINLKKIDLKRFSLNLFITLPHKVKEKKIAAFLEKKSKILETITKNELEKIEEAEAKKLAKKYDFFIASAKLMPLVATKVGRVLGPLGKMPNPKLGILYKENDEAIKEIIEKMQKTVRIVGKEMSVKMLAGKEDMKDEEIAENVETITKSVMDSLPNKKENIKSIMIKFTMSKPVEIK